MCNRLQNLNEKFDKVLEFLRTNPDLLSSRGKNLSNEKDIESLREKFKSQRLKTVSLTIPTTVFDKAVSVILAKSEGYSPEKLETIQYEHKLSMSAENTVGELLEMYIAEELEPEGWIWCSGSFVKAIDFIYPQNDGWKCLQVKNRDNTENSSSSKIRDGSEIKKWFRAYSKRNATNWENFPTGGINLSEENFLSFVENTIEEQRSD